MNHIEVHIKWIKSILFLVILYYEMYENFSCQKRYLMLIIYFDFNIFQHFFFYSEKAIAATGNQGAQAAADW